MSVLITTYQHERFVAEALDGVLEQRTDFSFEVLVGDDASTDGTRAVLARYAEAHPDRIRTYLPETNLGGGGKLIFQELIRRSRGDYIAQLDGDDYWTSPDKLQRQVAFLDEHPECSMCFHNVLCRYEDGSSPEVPYNQPKQAPELDVGGLLDTCPVASCSPVFRREIIDPLPDWYFALPWGDWPLYFLAAQHGSIRYLPDLMGVYRIHSGGMYRGLSPLDALRVMIDFYEGMEGIVPPEHEAHRRKALAKAWTARGLEHERLADYAAARRCLRESLRVRRVHLPLRRGSGERRRLRLWLRLTAPTPLLHPRARDPEAEIEGGNGRDAR
ncbi:MAG: glycosyltransferase [Actinomycetota bacterium]|nr:glycosyltransferase [Actinomycetota bacterium]